MKATFKHIILKEDPKTGKARPRSARRTFSYVLGEGAGKNAHAVTAVEGRGPGGTALFGDARLDSIAFASRAPVGRSEVGHYTLAAAGDGSPAKRLGLLRAGHAFAKAYLDDDQGYMLVVHKDQHVHIIPELYNSAGRAPQVFFEFKRQALKMPENLIRDLANPEIKWIIFINPPFATSQKAGYSGESKKKVSDTKVRTYIVPENFDKAMMVHAVRRNVKKTWMNDRDQFMQPSEAPCLVDVSRNHDSFFTLFDDNFVCVDLDDHFLFHSKCPLVDVVSKDSNDEGQNNLL